jgi:hypothetical protein
VPARAAKTFLFQGVVGMRLSPLLCENGSTVECLRKRLRIFFIEYRQVRLKLNMTKFSLRDSCFITLNISGLICVQIQSSKVKSL